VECNWKTLLNFVTFKDDTAYRSFHAKLLRPVYCSWQDFTSVSIKFWQHLKNCFTNNFAIVSDRPSRFNSFIEFPEGHPVIIAIMISELSAVIFYAKLKAVTTVEILFILIWNISDRDFSLPWQYLFIHSVFCLTTGPKPLPKRCLHIVRFRASSFKWEYPFLSLRSSSSFLRLLPRLLATSISRFIFPSITRFRRQFLRICTIWKFCFYYLSLQIMNSHLRKNSLPFNIMSSTNIFPYLAALLVNW